MSDASRRYPATVFWSEQEGGFVALAPDLPGCSAFGKTHCDALTELQDAIAGWIEAARAAGNAVPEPSARPEPEHYSGKLVLRLSRILHAKLAEAAKRERVSLNQHLLNSLVAADARAEALKQVDERLLHLLSAAKTRPENLTDLRIVVLSTDQQPQQNIDAALGALEPLGSKTTH